MNDEAMGGMPPEPAFPSHIPKTDEPDGAILQRIEQQERTTFDLFHDVKNGLGTILDAINLLPSNVIDALIKSDFFATRQNTGLRERIHDFSAERAGLEEERHKLSREVAGLRDENTIIKSQLEQKEAELCHAQGEMARMRNKEAVLRTIILDKAGNQKVSDKEVKDMFVLLRQQVQIISSSTAFDVNRSIQLPRGHSRSQTDFFDIKAWKVLSAKDRMNRVKAQMSFILYDMILDAKLFGLSGLEANDGDRSTPIEASLRRFERVLMDGTVNSAMVADWRILTIECGEQLNHRARTAKSVADRIFDFFTPILAKGSGQKLEQELQADLQELCNNAFKLRMMMRKSKEGYRCEMPIIDDTKRGRLSEYAHLAEEFGVEGGKNNEGGKDISYFLSAALTKHQGLLSEGKDVVLEKGYVILKRK